MADELRDYRLAALPGYMDWSRRVLDAGESPAFIANLDALKVSLQPSEVASLTDAFFDDLLADLKIEIEKFNLRGG